MISRRGSWRADIEYLERSLASCIVNQSEGRSNIEFVYSFRNTWVLPVPTFQRFNQVIIKAIPANLSVYGVHRDVVESMAHSSIWLDAILKE